MEKTFNIGVLGGAKVLQWSLLRPVKEIEHIQVAAIASRDLQKVKSIAAAHKIDNIFSSYEELLEMDSLDLIYIPLIHSLHTRWILEAAGHGKHVLVEKPICLTEEEAASIKEAAEHNRIQIFEGVMTQFHPWQDAVKAMIDMEQYGSLTEVDTLISTRIKEGEDNFRLKKELGGGAFYDESCYWLQMVQKTVGLKNRRVVYAYKEIGENGVDVTFAAELLLKKGIKSKFLCTFQGAEKAEHTFRFEKAVVKARNIFRCCYGSYKFNLEICSLEGECIGRITFEPLNYYVRQLLYIKDKIKNSCSCNMLEESVERIGAMNEIYQSAVPVASVENMLPEG